MRTSHFGLAATAAVLLSCNAIAAAAWKVEKLPDNAPLLQVSGCMGSFGPKGHANEQTLFLDDSVDVKAKANIKIAGRIFALDLVSAKTNGKSGLDASGPGTRYDRVFRDKTGAVSVTVSLVVGKEHPEADSTEMAGTLRVTYQGATQSIAIEGGVAC